MTLSQVREQLQRLNLQPSKSLGQNFLIDGNILRIILEAADVRRDETVVEIGPGLGVLTRELLPRAKHVIAVEKDARLFAYLRGELTGVELVHADAVKWLNQQPVIAEPFKVVANLPYSVSSPVIERFVERREKPRAMVFTLQREVAQRLGAPPRTKEYGALTLFTQLYFHVTVAHVISAHCFFPEPQVESAVVVLERRDPRVKLADGAPFHELVRRGFSQRRKMLRKLLGNSGDVEHAFAQTGISFKTRAEELSLEQWIALANEFRESTG